jgi:nicotinamidase-related amidase
MNPSQIRANEDQDFAARTWGGEFHPEFGPRKGDVIVLEHWAQSGFANTILVGMIANTCIEATARHGTELGYHVTLIKDATAAFSHEGMHAAHEVNGPLFAHAILTTKELLGLFPAEQDEMKSQIEDGEKE